MKVKNVDDVDENWRANVLCRRVYIYGASVVQLFVRRT